MEALCSIYVKGTDPATDYADLLCSETLISIMFHSFVYLVIILIVYKIMTNIPMKSKTAIIIWLILVLIMMIGYPLRLMRAKQLMAITKSKEETRGIMNSAYACWYFMG